MAETYNLSHNNMVELLKMQNADLENVTITGVLSGNIFKDMDVFDNNENGILIESFGVIENYPSIIFYMDDNGIEYNVALAHNVRITFDPYELDDMIEAIELSDEPTQEFTFTTQDVVRNPAGFEGIDIEHDGGLNEARVERLEQEFYDQHWPEIDPNWTLKVTVLR